MGALAAHQRGICICPQHDVSSSTTNGAVSNVTFNKIGAQAVGDQRYCLGKGGAVDTVIGGSGTVTVNGRSAVPCCKVVTEHGGTVLLGATNVIIGGPLIIGPHARFAKICTTMAAGREGSQLVADRDVGKLSRTTDYRNPAPEKQSWGMNCGPESMRMLINELGPRKLTEWELLKWSLENGHADWGESKPGTKIPRGQVVDPEKRQGQLSDIGETGPGGSNPSDWQAMSRENGFETETFGPNPGTQPVDECVAESLRQGKPVVFSTNSGWLDTDANGNFVKGTPGRHHVVLVTGYEADAAGRPTAFYVNDPARGCSIRVPAWRLAQQRRPGYALLRPEAAAW